MHAESIWQRVAALREFACSVGCPGVDLVADGVSDAFLVDGEMQLVRCVGESVWEALGERSDACAGFVGPEAKWARQALPVPSMDERRSVLTPDLLCHAGLAGVVEKRERRRNVVQRR